MRWVVFVLLLSVGFAQTTPKVGSPERKAIMDSLRKPVEKELGIKVIFKVESLKVKDGWAFMKGRPLQPNGKDVDYSKTKFAEEYKEGSFSDFVCGLLQKVKGKWKVRDYAVGPSDVAWDGWDKKYHAPASIFK